MVERCDRYTRLSKNVRASKPRIHERARPAKIDMTAVMPSGKKRKHTVLCDRHRLRAAKSTTAIRPTASQRIEAVTQSLARGRWLQIFAHAMSSAFGLRQRSVGVAGAWYGFGVLFTLQVCLAIQENLSASGHNQAAAIDAPFEAALSAVPCSCKWKDCLSVLFSEIPHPANSHASLERNRM